MVSLEDVKWFAKWIQEPVEFRSETLSKPLNNRVGEYQTLAKLFFTDLKSDGIITFTNVFSNTSEIDSRRVYQLIELSSNISQKLFDTKEFTGDEQFFILCMIYNSIVEHIKLLFLPYIGDIFQHLSNEYRKGKRKPNNRSTLGPVMEVLRTYKNGKYIKLFSDINVMLRNSIAHFTIFFGDEDIFYDGNSISGGEFLSLIYKLKLLYSILSKSIMKEFENDVIQELQHRRIIL